MSMFPYQYATIGSTYRGRFAPSPTGPLHLGSLLTAVASYLDAHYHQGEWLVRIEDVDITRTLNGASESILSSLKQHGLHSDLPVLYQSERHQRYEAVLSSLQQQQRTFECYCSRKQLAPYQQRHPPSCIDADVGTGPPSIRFYVDNKKISFEDRLRGQQPEISLMAEGPFVLKRRDQLFAYQLAVVVDDADQGITDVVRGVDIMPSTPKQIVLQQALNLPTPRYLHLPLVCNAQGQKLSKQNQAEAINPQTPIDNLLTALRLLCVDIPKPDLRLLQTPEHLLKAALPYWRPQQLPLTLFP